MKTTLVKKIEGFELWMTANGSIEQFWVKNAQSRARMMESLAHAEEFIAKAVRATRNARAH
jgi:NH3-dependent NAD+ synthetase